jgi:hypothetical protein
MKIGIVCALLVTGCSITLHEDPKVLDALNNISAHIDGLRAPAPAAQQPQRHLVCRNKDVLELPLDDKKDGDIEMPVKACPAPDDQAPCVGNIPLSNAAARCKAGKL